MSRVQVLTFKLADETFAFDISNVREVLDYIEVTKIPRMPNYMLGVINIRETAVPVISLHKKFDLGESERTVNTCIIVIEVDKGDEVLVFGILSDSVQEVISFDEDSLESAPKIGTGIDVSFISAMAKKDDEFVIILDSGRIIADEEVKEIIQAT